ncbi:pseudouridine synthase [Marinobacter sp. JSM 1782161]|uniref:pseudouridine synthase n=1 Tax=Marinobacter sp. JSM 1782161 TaxID=2685906 RepID=UPI0014025FC0|nr:pseudouridine synthase [Marinobacter sp. JSM 1782161]
MRLDFFLANAADMTRKEARRCILGRRVTINNELCRKAATHLADGDVVELDGQPLTLPGERYLMLNKPADVVSVTRDGEHTTVTDLLPPELRRNLHVAGRLDLDTTGLVLLTTDGQWSHRVTSPRAKCSKRYRVELAEPWTSDMVSALEQGVTLKSDNRPTAPAGVEPLSEKQLRLTLSEGRYHQVKRMLAAVGNHVTGLHREAIGAVTLDPELGPGEYRSLTEAEIDSFR